MTANRVKPESGAPVQTSSTENPPATAPFEGNGDNWCLPSGQPLVEFALSAGLLAPGLLRLAEAHAADVNEAQRGGKAQDCVGQMGNGRNDASRAGRLAPRGPSRRPPGDSEGGR